MGMRIDEEPATGNDSRAGRRRFLGACLCSLGAIAVGGGISRVAALSLKGDQGREGDDSPGPWSVEARFATSSGDVTHCRKCPHACVLSPGEAGKCRNRVNHKGKLYSIAYGNPCAVHVDPIEKKPFFHYLPGTRAFSIAAAGCNLRCLNCQNWQISQFSPRETENADLMPVRVVEEATEAKCASIAYTYSEPTTFYEYTFDTSRLGRARGIRNLLKSNGYINEEALRHLCRYLDAANIDLKSFSNSTYRRLSEGSLEPVLRTLKVLREEGVWLEITYLVIPEWTDDQSEIARMCDWLCKSGLADAPLHFSRFVPLHKLTQLPATPVSALEQARAVAGRAGVQYVYIGNVPGHSAESTVCHRCGKVVIERRGFTVVRQDLAKGACRFCGQHIPGVWS